MKKVYGLIKGYGESNYNVHESCDELKCYVYFSLEECKNAFKSDIDDFLGWTFCDYTKEELIEKYNNKDYETGIEEYKETEDNFYVSYDCDNFRGYYSLHIVELEIDDNINEENISFYIVELIERDRQSSLEIKVFDNDEDKNNLLYKEVDEFISRFNIPLDELKEEIENCVYLTDINLGGNKYLEEFQKGKHSGFIKYYEKDGKNNPSSSIQYYTHY